MSNDIPRHNQEHYRDETAHDALAAVAKEESAKAERAASPCHGRKLIFVCSPFRGETEYNIRCARSYCRFVISRNKVPFAPHLFFTQFLGDSVRRERSIGLSCSAAVLKRCDELWTFGLKATSGMRAEIEAAERLGIPIRRFDSQCRKINDCIGVKTQ